MSDPTNTPCPFGAEYQVNWNMRYRLFSKFDQAQVDATGLYTMIPEALGLDMAQRAGGAESLDVCSGVGAMSIALARAGQHVTAVEINEGRVEMARHNAKLYDVAGQIEFLAADITAQATLDALPGNLHTVFLDPPWGKGPSDYKRRPITRFENLKLTGMDIRHLLEQIKCTEVMMKLPPNFDVGVFRSAAGEKIAYVNKKGFLHWYFVRMPKDEFIAIPDQSPPGLSVAQSREGFRAYLAED